MTVLNTTGFVLILPYIDQGPLYNAYNFSSPSTTFDINGNGDAAGDYQ